MIQTGLADLHLGCGVTDHEFALEHCVGRVVGIQCVGKVGFELGELGAVSCLLAAAHISEGEFLAALKHDVLLEHTFAGALVVSLVDTVGHGKVGGYLGNPGSLANHIETVLGDFIHIGAIRFLLFASYNS